MSPPKIFITGTSGYIGGDVLCSLLAAHPDWESSITCLLRDRSHESRFTERYPKLKLFYATFQDAAAIEAEVAKHDLVLHFAVSADDVPSATAIINGLSKRGGGYYIHTSGMDVLLNPDLEGSDSREIHTFDDWDGIGELTSLPDGSPHRDVDKIVLAAGSETLKTVIVCPATVYGVGRGPGSQRSHQIHQLTQLILKSGKGMQLGDGKAFWSSVHVYDLSRLYLALIEDVVFDNGRKATWNLQGYYLAESGEFVWGEVSRRITDEAYRRRLIQSDDIRIVDMTDKAVMAPAGRPIANYTARSRALRAKRLLGWEPKEGSLLDEVPEIVEMEAKELGLVA